VIGGVERGSLVPIWFLCAPVKMDHSTNNWPSCGHDGPVSLIIKLLFRSFEPVVKVDHSTNNWPSCGHDWPVSLIIKLLFRSFEPVVKVDHSTNNWPSFGHDWPFF
jgi:hypothetical protein